MDWQVLANPADIANTQRSLVLGVGTFGKLICSELVERLRLLDSLYARQGTRITDLVHFVCILDPDAQEAAYPISETRPGVTEHLRAMRSMESRENVFQRFRFSARSIYDLIRHELERVSKDSLRPSSGGESVSIYVVASLCEVQGSAGFWSLGRLCRRLVEDTGFRQSLVHGICSTASFSEGDLNYWELANAYVSLREAQVISTGNWDPWNGSQFTPERKGSPFDHLYLFTREKQNALRAGDPAELEQAVSILLETYILTSATRCIEQVLLDDVGVSDTIQVSACGASAAIIPIRELHEFNARRLAGEIIKEGILRLTGDSADRATELIAQLTSECGPLSTESLRRVITEELELEQRNLPSPGTYWPGAVVPDAFQRCLREPADRWVQLVEEYDRQLVFWELRILDPQLIANLDSAVEDLVERIRDIITDLTTASNDGLLAATAFLKELGSYLADRLRSPELTESNAMVQPDVSRDRRLLVDAIADRPSLAGALLRFSLWGILAWQTFIALFSQWYEGQSGLLTVPIVPLVVSIAISWLGGGAFLEIKRRLRHVQLRRTTNQYTLLHKWRLEKAVEGRMRHAYERILNWIGRRVDRLEQVTAYLDQESSDFAAATLDEIGSRPFLVFPVAELGRCQELYSGVIPDSHQLATMDCLKFLDFQSMLNSVVDGEPSTAGRMIATAVRDFAYSNLPHPRIQKAEHFIPIELVDDLANHMWNCSIPWVVSESEKAYDRDQISLSLISSALGSDGSAVVTAFCRDFDSFSLTTANPYAISLLRQDHGLQLKSVSIWDDLEKAYRALGSDTVHLHLDPVWADANLPAPFADDSEARSTFQFVQYLFTEEPPEEPYCGLEEAPSAEPSLSEPPTPPVADPGFIIEEVNGQEIQATSNGLEEDKRKEAMLLPIRLSSTKAQPKQTSQPAVQVVSESSTQMEKPETSESASIELDATNSGLSGEKPPTDNGKNEREIDSVSEGPTASATVKVPVDGSTGTWKRILQWLRDLVG